MHDPFPLPRPQGLLPYVEQFAEKISLKTLPLHFHEVMFAFVLYHATYKYAAPVISRLFIPQIYSTFSARTKLNWDVHIVSFTQSTLICGLALWVMWADQERAAMTSAERVHGYTGGSGLIQAFAAGYFVWDLLITLQNMHAFGIGMLFHAISALCVFALGFRPFVNYYAPTFILYELSSPFLNIHWFCDKLNMTGGKLQLYNGILLLLTFFSCRLMWGSYQSIRVFRDVWSSFTSEPAPIANPKLMVASAIPGLNDTMDFAGDQTVPLWISGAYLTSNLILNSLNWYWFSKMIATLRKRFDPPLGTRKPTIQEPTEIDEDEKVLIEGTHVETPVATPNVTSTGTDLDYVSAKLSKSGTHLEVEGEEIRTRSKSGSRKKR